MVEHHYDVIVWIESRLQFSVVVWLEKYPLCHSRVSLACVDTKSSELRDCKERDNPEKIIKNVIKLAFFYFLASSITS